MPEVPLYLDWSFWTALGSILAILLSQLPPVKHWFRPARTEVDVQTRVQIAHKVGNPNIGLYINLHNVGGRELKVKSLNLRIKRDKLNIELDAINYYEQTSSQTAVLFVPFILKPLESWGHITNFLNYFDRSTEKRYRKAESAHRTNIHQKQQLRLQNDQSLVIADQEFVTPLEDLFRELFIWEAGEYIMELTVNTVPKTASCNKKYRFTLYESDSEELASYVKDYKYGGGVWFNMNNHTGLFIPFIPFDENQ